MIAREEVLTACQEGADHVWTIIAKFQQQQLAENNRHILALEEEIRLLKHRLGQHSQNSHNPPSADRFVKPRESAPPQQSPDRWSAGPPRAHPAPGPGNRCG